MATPAPPPSDNGGLFGAVGNLFTKAKEAVAETVAPLAPSTPPATLPGAAPEAPGKTLTGGRRHRRKTRGGKRRSTRKTTRRVGKHGGVTESSKVEVLVKNPIYRLAEEDAVARKKADESWKKWHAKTGRGKKGGRKYY